MAVSERKLPCPLCNTPVKPKFLAPTGTCFFCADQKKYFLRELTTHAHEEDAKHIEKSKQLFRRLVQFAEDKREREIERQKLRELEKEKKKIQEMYREQASVALAKRSLLHYTERYSPGYDASWAHESVAGHVEQFYRDVVDKKSPRLIIALPSRFGKSLLASNAAPAWALGNWPWMKIILTSYSDVLPTEFSRNIRAQLQSPEFRQIFPNGAHLSKDDASVKSWSTVEGGGVKAVGVGGGLLGQGCHALCIDDPVKDMEEADNPTTLEKVYDWFSSVAYSRQLPGAGVLIIMQRMSHDDLVGRLERKMKEEREKVLELRKDAEEIRNDPDATFDQLRDADLLDEEADELETSMDHWTILDYPALASSNEYLDQATGDIVRTNNADVDESKFKLLRRVGDALHPKRYNRSYLLKLKRANPRRFAAMYLLRPISEEGAYFNESDFKRYAPGSHPKLDFCHVFCAWDQALGAKQSNDWTVGLAGAVDHEGNLWLLERVRGKFPDVRVASDLVIDLHVRWKAQITGIEKTHISMAMGPILKDRMRERGEYIVLAEGKEELRPITDKKMRARTLQGLCRSGKVYVPEGDDWDHFINILVNFGATSVDDDVDAAAWLAILATRQPPPRNPKAMRDKSNRLMDMYDRLFKKREDAGSDSYMAS